MLTREQERRVIAAIDEAQRGLNRELGYQPDLRNTPLMAFYEAHIAKLTRMLDPTSPTSPYPSRQDRQGMGSFFVYHNCYKCNDGLKPCVTPKGNVCQYPHARDD